MVSDATMTPWSIPDGIRCHNDTAVNIRRPRYPVQLNPLGSTLGAEQVCSLDFDVRLHQAFLMKLEISVIVFSELKIGLHWSSWFDAFSISLIPLSLPSFWRPVHDTKESMLHVVYHYHWLPVIQNGISFLWILTLILVKFEAFPMCVCDADDSKRRATSFDAMKASYPDKKIAFLPSSETFVWFLSTSKAA